MEHTMNKKQVQTICILLCAFILTSFLFWFTYMWDNKYTSQSSQPYSLVENWEFYNGKLYTPNDLNDESVEPFETIYIGQFGNYAQGNRSDYPFGVATYRKVLHLEENPSGWLLELPEIYSLSNVYVNGDLVRTYGELNSSSYQTHTQNTLLPLPSGDVELLIQSVNYSHYYSGMIYPPPAW